MKHSEAINHYNETNLFPTRYHAKKFRDNSPWHNGNEVIVKFCGGYQLMSANNYRIARNQK